jgi:2,4-dienoyl-CoA reductase-like NADH-dependent reductase (Old Yellow Enzyme family)
MSEHFRSAEDAMAYTRVHDDHAKRLTRANMPTLRGAAASERQANKVVLLEGGSVSKDELIAEILALRYPLIAEARALVAEKQLALAARVQAELDAQESS